MELQDPPMRVFRCESAGFVMQSVDVLCYQLRSMTQVLKGCYREVCWIGLSVPYRRVSFSSLGT